MQLDIVRHGLRAGRPSIGTWLTLDSAVGAEWMAHQGFDWLAVEQTRGPQDRERVVRLLRAIGTASALPLLRVPWKEPRTVAQALDAGASGLIIPGIETRAEAEQCLEATRSAGGRTAYPPDASPLVVVALDSVPGLENVEEIVGVAGIDVCFVNPGDLCAALGIERCQEPADRRYLDAIGTVRAACQSHGVAAGIQVRTAERALRHLAEGWQFVGVGSDGELMARAAAQSVAAIREGTCNGPRP